MRAEWAGTQGSELQSGASSWLNVREATRVLFTQRPSVQTRAELSDGQQLQKHKEEKIEKSEQEASVTSACLLDGKHREEGEEDLNGLILIMTSL